MHSGSVWNINDFYYSTNTCYILYSMIIEYKRDRVANILDVDNHGNDLGLVEHNTCDLSTYVHCYRELCIDFTHYQLWNNLTKNI